MPKILVWRGNRMSFSPVDVQAKDVWFDEQDLWVSLRDGRQLSVPLAYFPRLLNASSEQRKQFELSGGGSGIHWDAIDEDVSVAGLLLGHGDVTLLRRSA